MKRGSMIKNSHTGEIGIVIKIVGDELDPHAVIVKTEDRYRKWFLKKEKKISMIDWIKSWFRAS